MVIMRIKKDLKHSLIKIEKEFWVLLDLSQISS